MRLALRIRCYVLKEGIYPGSMPILRTLNPILGTALDSWGCNQKKMREKNHPTRKVRLSQGFKKKTSPDL